MVEPLLHTYDISPLLPVVSTDSVVGLPIHIVDGSADAVTVPTDGVSTATATVLVVFAVQPAAVVAVAVTV